MKIYIPTLGRVDNQVTFNGLPDKWKEKVVMVVQQQERHLYKFDVEYLVVPENHGIARTRRDLINHAGKTKFAMYDDDIRMFTRVPDFKENGTKCRVPFTEQDWDDWFELALTWLEEPDMAQVGPRGGDFVPVWYSDSWKGQMFQNNRPPFCASVINGEIIQKFTEDIPWTMVESGEDTTFILSYLTRGYTSRLSQKFVFMTDFYATGGLTDDGRSAARELADYTKLVAYWPYVRFGEPSKTNPGSMRLRINWKKAYTDSKINPIPKEILE